jgi:UDP-N-acetylmuramoylalanine--D-glutamate ligase
MHKTSTSKLKVVIGLGKTGLSCLRYLKAQGANVAAIDSRDNPPTLDIVRAEFASVPIFLGGFNSPLLAQASELVVSPGVSLAEPAIAAQIARGVKISGDIELFVRAVKAPIVAITGSNGKSTVTTLVGEMAKAAGIKVKVGGNLGTPALDFLSDDDEARLYVLELSSFQLETTTSLKAAAAVVLNISPDHMDRYADLAAYTKAKQTIYQGCKSAVINRDDPVSYQNVTFLGTVFSFGLDAPTHGEFGLRDGFLAYGADNLLASNELKIKGRHQIANALAALALGTAIHLPLTSMLKALREFPGLPYRCEWVAQINGVDFYDDSKGTNVGATEAAIAGLGAEIKGKVILIAGGIGKDADFKLLRKVAEQYVRTVVLIGRDGPMIENALQGCCQMVRAVSMAEAVALAQKAAESQDAVLLSPACASFDMFKNFEHRGDVFKEEVKKIIN